MNKKIISVLIHFPVWIVALFIAYFSSSDDVPPGSNSTYIIRVFTNFTFWFIASFYSFYSYLVPKYLEKGRFRTFWLYALFAIVIIIPACTFLLAHILGVAVLSLSDSFTVKGLFPWAGTIMGTILCGGLGVLYRFSIDWFYNLQIRRDLENTKLKSELVAIKSKLNPHLLFNTLNNIDTLIQTNSEKASGALSKLSNLLRYVVYETENDKVSIQKEINIISEYLDLERLRLSQPNAVSFTSSIPKDFLIPPMVFLPFIENGFKHSNLNESDQTLNISIVEENNVLTFKCFNTINIKKVSKKEGLGLDLVKKRLELLFPDQYDLTIEESTNEFNVLLEIRLNHD